MAQDITLTIDGLHTNPSDLSEVPKGALKTAKNVDIDRPSVATPRKGFARHGAQFSNTSARVGSVFFFDDKTLVRRSDDVLQYWNGSAWTAYSGTVAVPKTNVPVRMVPGGKSAYFTTAAGIQKLSSATASLTQAGIDTPHIMAVGTTSNTYAYSIPAYSRINYRVTFVREDENGVVLESPPSEIVTCRNYSSGSRRVAITVRTPTTYSIKIRLYASEVVDASVLDSLPSDPSTLVYEGASQVFSGGSVTIFDERNVSVPITLYTDSTQQGIAAANTEPPVALDIAAFNNYAFYLAPAFKQRLLLNLIYKDNTTGDQLEIGDQITIAGQTYTADTTRDIANKKFRCPRPEQTFTSANVNTTTDAITITAHGFDSFGLDTVEFSTTGTLPAPLVADTRYRVTINSANDFNLLTLADVAVDLTTGGSGTHTVHFCGAGTIGHCPVITDKKLAWVETVAQDLVHVINWNSSSPAHATYISDLTSTAGEILLESKTSGASAFTVTIDDNDYAFNPNLDGSGRTSSDDYAPNKLAWSKQFQPDSVPLTNVHPGIGSARAAALRILPTRDSLFILKEDGVFRLTGATAETFSVEDFDTSVQIIAPKAACVLDNMIFCMTSEGPAIVSDLGVEKRFGDPILKELMDLRGRTSAKVAHFDANTWATAHDKRWILSVGYLDGSAVAQTKIYVFNVRTKKWTSWSKTLTCAESNPFDGNLYAGSADYAYLLVQNRETYDDADSGTDTPFESEIEWVVKTFGNPAALNQYSGIQVVMLDDFPVSGSLITSTDTNTTPITQTLTSHGGTARRPHRKSVPRNHQRASTLSVKVKHSGAGYYEIAGIAIEGTRTSTRTQK